MYLGIFATAGTAGADVETHSGTQWESTGWTQVSFYRGDGPDGYEDECPKWAWAEYIGGISWQSWNLSGGGVYDKLTQDFWKGLIGTEANSGEPNDLDEETLTVSEVGAAHYNGGTDISTAYPNGTCFQDADPIWIPCNESNSNTGGYDYTDPIVYGYVCYEDSHYDEPVSPNGALPVTVLDGYIS